MTLKVKYSVLGLANPSLGKQTCTFFLQYLLPVLVSIRSCAQLTTEDAYKVIDGGSLDDRCVANPIRQDIENDIRSLSTITDKLYHRRTESGCLTQLRDETSFEFDSDQSPVGVSVLSKPILKHRMVKELLLLANTSVARKISSRLPEEALLRRHSSPVDRKIVSKSSAFLL